MKWLVLGVIRMYQAFLSPLLPRACRFHPSCSEYVSEAVKERGLLQGGFLGVKRILRCHPWSQGGFDPVP
jgi:putative membrane protein insertion efficiency factor